MYTMESILDGKVGEEKVVEEREAQAEKLFPK